METMTIDVAITALNESMRERYEPPFYYDLYVGRWASGSVHAVSNGEGRLQIGLLLDRGVTPAFFQEFASQAELLVSDANSTEETEPLARSGFRYISVGSLHLIEADFDLPDDCEAYRCQIQRKEE